MAAAPAAVSKILELPIEEDLCKLNISDAWHDFKPNFHETEYKYVHEMMPRVINSNTCKDVEENTLADNMLNLIRIPPKVGIFKFNGTNEGQQNHPYMKNYDIFQVDGSSNLDNKFHGMPFTNKTIYFIVDTNYEEFVQLLKTSKKTSEETFSSKYLYVQNRQTLYDPAGKTTPSTQAGKTLFTSDRKVNMRFAWEDTSKGISTNYTYPNYNRKLDIKESLYCKYHITHILKSNGNHNYLSQVASAFMDIGGNKIVVFNKEIARKSTGAILGAIECIIKKITSQEITHAEIQKLCNSPKKIVDLTQAYHYVAKRLGDQGQALSTCADKMNLRVINYDGQGKVKKEESIAHVSNGNHCLVTIDRPAMVGALMYGVPMVLFNYPGSTKLTLFINKRLNDDFLYVQEYYERFKNLYEENSVFFDTPANHKEITDENGIKNKEFDFILNYKNKYTKIEELIYKPVDGIYDKYNKTEEFTTDEYKDFLKDCLLASRYIQLLNSIEFKKTVDNWKTIKNFYDSDFAVLTREFTDYFTDKTESKRNNIKTRKGTKIIEDIKQNINDLNKFNTLMTINMKYLRQIDVADPTSDVIKKSVEKDYIFTINMDYLDFLQGIPSTELAPEVRLRSFEEKTNIYIGTKIVRHILSYFTFFNKLSDPISNAYEDIKTILETRIINKWVNSDITTISDNLPALKKHMLGNIVSDIIKTTDAKYNSNTVEISDDMKQILFPEYVFSGKTDEEIIKIINEGEQLDINIQQGGENPSYTIMDYYKDSCYLHSILLLYLIGKDNTNLIEYPDPVYDQESFDYELIYKIPDSDPTLQSSFPTSVLSFLFNFTLEEDLKKDINPVKIEAQLDKHIAEIKEEMNDSSIYFYDFFEDQISSFQDLQAIYYLFNKEYYNEYDESMRVKVPFTKRLLDRIIEKKERMIRYIGDLYIKQGITPKSPLLNISWFYNYIIYKGKMIKKHHNDARYKAMIKNRQQNPSIGGPFGYREMIEGTVGGRRRFRKTKRKNRHQKPSKKYTRRYKNPQKKSKTRTRTRK